MILLLSVLLACGTSEPTTPTPAPVTTPAPAPTPAPAALPTSVARAVELARAIKADPANAEAALASKGGTQAELDRLMFEIAADPALTEAYTKALGL